MPNPNYVHTITLYNCLKAADSPDKKDHWYRHVLTDCYYKAAITRIETGANAGMQNTYTVRVPESIHYQPYCVWSSMPGEEREKNFTVSLDDLVIAGECVEEITGESGQTAAQVMKRYKPDAFKVTAISNNTKTKMGKHYRLGG